MLLGKIQPSTGDVGKLQRERVYEFMDSADSLDSLGVETVLFLGTLEILHSSSKIPEP